MNKAIVTVLLGKYDTLKPAPRFKGWDAVLFTDHHYPNTMGWIVNKVKSDNPLVDSRYYKWLTHLTLPTYSAVCYIDASMVLKQEPPTQETWFAHPQRINVKQESDRIIKLKKAPEAVIQQQNAFYKAQDFTDKEGLYQNGFFVRNHTKPINEICEYVYKLVQLYSNRDQIALPFALFKHNFKLNNIQSGASSYKYVKLHPHVKLPQQVTAGKSKTHNSITKQGLPTVHHITPGRSDKNIGLAINSIIEKLPDNDWICVRDIDTMPAYHEKFFEQCEQIALEGSFGLVSCVTNRLGLRYQMHNETLSNNTDWLHHRKIGKQRYDQHGSNVIQTKETVAGLMMLFSKSVWKDVGGFPEGAIQINGSFFDYHFSMAIKNKRYKIGIAHGIYLIHMYRPDYEQPRRQIQHLLN